VLMTSSIPGSKSGSDPTAREAMEWEALLPRFLAADPGLVESRALQRRADTKFVLPISALPALLSRLADDYSILRAGSALVADYRTLYFDTADFEFFHAHRRGRRVRHKVRVRHYPDRCVSFLEVKTRLSPMETIKGRMQRSYGENELSPRDHAFVRERTGASQDLAPQVWTHFRRVSLLGVRTQERVTIDCGLRVAMGHRPTSLPNLAIVEIKQARFARNTPVLRALAAGGWRPGWASKYCIAIALTHPEVRLNRLLAHLRSVERESA